MRSVTPPHPPSSPATGSITLRYWAAAAAAAGVDSDAIEVSGPVSLGALKVRARELHDGRRFADVLSCCSVLVGDRPANRDDERLVEPGSTVEFLPPFAGG